MPANAVQRKNCEIFAADKQKFFTDLSTYDENYSKKKVEVSPPLRPNPPDHRRTFHFGTYDKPLSVSQDTYRAYNKPEFLSARRKPVIIKDPEGVFTATPINKTPIYNVKDVPGSNMEFSTTQRTDYTYKKPSPRCNPVAPMTQAEYRRRREACCKVDLMTTFMGDYVTYTNVDRPKSFQPIRVYEPPTQPFQNPSVYSKDFTEPIKDTAEQKFLRGSKKTARIGDTVFKHTTIYKDEHCGYKPLKRSKTCVPRLQQQKNDGQKFCDETFYKTTYKRPDTTAVRKNFKPIPSRQPPNLAFMNDSTAHAHYSGDAGLPSRRCKPETKPRM